MSTYRGVNARLAKCLNSVLYVKALIGAFSVIVQLQRLIVCSTSPSKPCPFYPSQGYNSGYLLCGRVDPFQMLVFLPRIRDVHRASWRRISSEDAGCWMLMMRCTSASRGGSGRGPQLSSSG